MHIKNRFFLSFLLISSLANLVAQDFSSFDCPLRENGSEYQYPFTGGFSAPQFSEIDMNQDGIQDLFVFDRVGNVPTVFLADGTGGSKGYQYTTAYDYSFPELCCWTLVRDFNRDGIGDLFTVPLSGGISGVQLYQGSIDNGVWSFESRRMGGEPGDEEIIWFELGNSKINVTIPFNDLPDIVDVDFDGDLDILSFDLGGSFVVYYKNMQEELGLPKDTMVYEYADMCFGKFKEGGFSETIFLSDDDSVCAVDSIKGSSEENKSGGLHSGSTIMAFDNDDDMDMDLVLGDLTNRGLVYLENGGTSERNFMTSVDTDYPSYDFPVDMSIFLGAFNVDVDADGLKDMIVSPNEVSSISNTDNIWFYKNTGNPQARFSLNKQGFLTEETVDVGSFSCPRFVDYNQDGLMDLVVTTDGEFGAFGPASLAMYLYENVGTSEAPEFMLVDDDYLGFRAFASTSRNPVPAFGDLDGDDDIDLVMGDIDGYLYFFENTAGPSQTLAFANPVYKYMDIDIGQGAAPAIADLNNDGLGDLIVGDRSANGFNDTLGSINYFQNLGTIGNAMFDPDVTLLPNYPILGVMDTRLTMSAAEKALASPVVIQEEDETHFFIGSDKGHIKQYRFDPSDFYGQYDIVSEALGDLNLGRSSSVDLYDIDDDGFLEMIIGNKRGGLNFYNTDVKSMTTSVDSQSLGQIKVYPNPSSNVLYIDTPGQVPQFSVFNLNGQLMLKNQGQQVDVSNLPPGVYLLDVLVGEQSYKEKIIKI